MCVIYAMWVLRLWVPCRRLDWIDVDFCELWEEDENESYKAWAFSFISSFLGIEGTAQNFMQLSRCFPFDKRMK